jgi:hypothetical protein
MTLLPDWRLPLHDGAQRLGRASRHDEIAPLVRYVCLNELADRTNGVDDGRPCRICCKRREWLNRAHPV